MSRTTTTPKKKTRAKKQSTDKEKEDNSSQLYADTLHGLYENQQNKAGKRKV